MARMLQVGLVLAVLLSCGAFVWAAQRAAVAPFVLPGATDLRTTWTGFGTLRVTYQATGAPFAWRGDLAQRLRQDGWSGRSYSNVGARKPPFATVWYTSEVNLGPLVLIERVVFGGDADTPNLAILDVARELRFR